MFRIIKWFFLGFMMVLLWQISQIMDDNRGQISDVTLRLGDDFEKSAHEVIKQSKDNIQNMQQNMLDSVKQASKQYMGEIIK